MSFQELTTVDYLPEVIDFCWDMTNRHGSGYPTKMWQRVGLEEMVHKTFEYPGDQVLLWREETLKAVVLLLVDKESNYLQTIGGIYSDDMPEALDQLLDYRDSTFPGFELLIGYPDSKEIRETLSARGDLLEASSFYEHTEQFEGNFPVHQVMKEEFLELQSLHDKAFPDIYWTSTRLLEKFDDWLIYRQMASDSYSFSLRYDDGVAEVFGFHQPTDELIQGTVRELKALGSLKVITSADQADALNELLVRSGFRKTGDYVAYRF